MDDLYKAERKAGELATHFSDFTGMMVKLSASREAFLTEQRKQDEALKVFAADFIEENANNYPALFELAKRFGKGEVETLPDMMGIMTRDPSQRDAFEKEVFGGDFFVGPRELAIFLGEFVDMFAVLEGALQDDKPNVRHMPNEEFMERARKVAEKHKDVLDRLDD